MSSEVIHVEIAASTEAVRRALGLLISAGAVISPQPVLDRLLGVSSDGSPPEVLGLPLSSREKEIVVCVVKGMTNRQIGEQLHLSHHTIGTHRRNISAKLDIHSTSGLTVYAISNKLVRLDELH